MLKKLTFSFNFFALFFVLFFAQCNRKRAIQKITPISNSLELKDSINISIIKLENYLGKIDYAINDNNIIYMIADLLSKHFHRKINIPKLPTLIERNPIYTQNHWMLYSQYFADRTYHDIILKKEKQLKRDSVLAILQENITNMDYRSFWCMYCNIFPVTNVLLNEININANKSEYDLTHAALQVQFIIENNYCHLDEKEINALKTKTIEHMNNEVRLYFKTKETSNRDLLMEEFAFLAYMQQYKLLNKDYVRFALSIQNTDGGMIYKNEKSAAHISVLAYWFLLEAAQHIDLFQEHFE